MSILARNKKKILILAVFIAVLILWCVSCSMTAYYEPDCEKKDIVSLIDKENPSKDDFEFMGKQTGVSPDVIEEMFENGDKEDIIGLWEQYFEKPNYENEYLFYPLVAYDRKKGKPLKFIPLKRGDVLVSLSTRTLGYRHGHAAIVTDGQSGQIIEHMVLGEVSDYSHISGWKRYSNFAVLRYKNSEVAEKAVTYAEERLIGVPYNPFAGVFKKDKSDEDVISSSQCSHLVWQAFYAVGADIDGDGGQLAFPADFLECDDFEIVQTYGLKI